jgi:hypothetical protein
MTQSDKSIVRKMLFKYIPNLNPGYYKSSKCKCSPRTLYPFPTEWYSMIYSKQRTSKKHSTWSIAPRKISKQLQTERQQKYLLLTQQKQKLSQKGIRRPVIAPSWKAINTITNNRNYNPYSPLSEEEEDDEVLEEASEQSTSRTNMSTKSKQR